MNERIRELAEQASLYARSDNSSMVFENYQKRYTEKFAELIVRECASKVDNILREKKDGGGTMGDEIREHFGVEEQEKVASKPECSVCGTTENVKYMGGYQPYLCESVDCIPF